jgi:hypothetical protein
MCRDHLSDSKLVIVMILEMVLLKKQTDSLISWMYLLLTLLLFSPFFTHITDATNQTANSITIHGGGMTGIDCPDGSSVDSDLSFVVSKSDNGTILGNWTIDSTENISSESNGFNQGPIYRGNLSTGYFNIQGETYNSEEEISICPSPVFAPISLVGQCGQDVTITIRFQSNDPLDITDSFIGDVECQAD